MPIDRNCTLAFLYSTQANLEETVDRLFSLPFILSRSVNHEGLLERFIPGSVLVTGQFHNGTDTNSCLASVVIVTE